LSNQHPDQQTTAVTGNTITAAVWNNEFSNIINEFNGNIENANIKAGAGIAYSKLSLSGSITNADLAGSISASKISDTAVTLTASQTISNKTLTKPNVHASVPTLKTNSDGATVTFDMSDRNHHIVTLGGNRTLAVSNVSTGQAFIVHLKQDGTGSRTVTWWGSINWAGGSEPTLTTTASKVDSFGFIYDGTNYFGYIIGQNI